MLNFFSIYNRFMDEIKSEPASVTEVALFNILLHEANARRWEMPFPYSTQLICLSLSTSKQNLFYARDKLVERGYIKYEKGSGKGSHAKYTIIDKNLSKENIPDHLTDSLTIPLTDSHTVNNNINNNNNIKRNVKFNGSQRRSVDVIAGTESDYEGKF